MSKLSVPTTRTKLFKIYGGGILAFTVIVGFMTLFVKFVVSMNLK